MTGAPSGVGDGVGEAESDGAADDDPATDAGRLSLALGSVATPSGLPPRMTASSAPPAMAAIPPPMIANGSHAGRRSCRVACRLGTAAERRCVAPQSGQNDAPSARSAPQR